MKKIFTLAILTLNFVQINAQNCIENTNSITFDGLNSYASPVNQTNLNITDSFTVEAWINPSSFAFNSANNSIVCKHGWSSGEGGFVLRCGGSGELSFNIAGLDPNQNPVSWVEVLSPTNALSLNTWTHVAGSYDGQNLKLYINGVEINITPFTGSIVGSPNYPLTIGKLSDPNQFAQRFFDGKIDEVRIWHRALPATELISNMNQHIDPINAVNLISYWRFNEGTGNNSIDLQSGNDITLSNSNWDVSVPFNAVPPTPTITFNGGMLVSSAATGQWYLAGIAISGATTMNYTPIVTGDYTFTTDPNTNGCTNTSAVYTITSVGIEKVNGSFKVNVYPNPMIDEAIISINSAKNYHALSFEVFDIAGRNVYSESSLAINPGENKININKSILIQGIYFYVFTNNKQRIAKGKLMVN